MSVIAFTCPTGCGCVVEYETGQPPIALRVVSQCAAHAGLASPQALFDEIWHFHGNAHRPDTCGCSVAYWWDDRVHQGDRVHTPVEHPVHTKRCELHAHHTDHVAHHDAVVADNRAKNIAVNAAAERHGIPPHEIPWKRHEAGHIVVDYEALGIAPTGRR
jgi:hypothetical protein